MSSDMWPDDPQLPTGEKRVNLGPDGKFCEEDIATGRLPSNLPPETMNLILGNFENAISAYIGAANNADEMQLRSVLSKLENDLVADFRDASNLDTGTIPANRLSASIIRDKIKAVDGVGSGIDADRLDGQDGSYYRNASNLNTGTIPSSRLNASHIRDKLKTVDGVGSGIDADRLDGQHLSDILDAIYPVGYTYAQYPGGKTPAAMGWPGRWDSKFETEGVFFRTPGGKAYPFGAGVQEDAFQRFAIAAKSVYGNSAGSQRGWSAHGGTYTQNGTNYARLPGSYTSYFADYSSHYGMPRTSTETRPKNRTFRVWIRTE